MTAMPHRGLLTGVIEGFYGPPWSAAERRQMLAWMRAAGLNTYVYAPKDDLKHRGRWREAYTGEEARALRELVHSCRRAGIRFVYALSPGLDLRYSSDADAASIRRRLVQVGTLGVGDFALLFDDIPDRVAEADLWRWGSLAAAQCALVNGVQAWLRERGSARLLFCPTPYCGRMARSGLGGSGYLETIGRELHPEIDVLWTGPEIVSREITLEHVRKVAAVIRRRPVVWDNLFANDYDGRRFFCGPYVGRPPALRALVGGLLVNPNCELPLNFVPVRTFGAYLRTPARGRWNPRGAYLAALRAWRPAFATGDGAPAWREFVRFCDAHYLPHEDGPEAEAFLRRIRSAVEARPAEEVRREVARLRDFCAQLAELRDRPLFHALWRRAWEMREELDLLERHLGSTAVALASDFHLPGTFRGGWVTRLQRVLAPRDDGSFAPP